MAIQGGYQPQGDGPPPNAPTTGSGVRAPQSELRVNQVDVAKLNIRPGDVLMVKVDRPITQDTAERIRRGFQEAFEKSGGNLPEILVIDGGIEVQVVRKEAT